MTRFFHLWGAILLPRPKYGQRRAPGPSTSGSGWRGNAAELREPPAFARGRRQPRLHRWLLPPLQDHSSTGALSAVEAPVTSRHSPDRTAVTVPSGLMVHCWLAWPLQDQTTTLVPGLVPWP